MIKKQDIIFLLIIFIFILPCSTYAEISRLEFKPNNLNKIIENQIKSQFSFSGLGSFYNNVSSYIVDREGVKKVDHKTIHKLSQDQSLALIGHYKILIINKMDIAFSFVDGKIYWQKIKDNEKKLSKNNLQAKLLLKSDLIKLSKPFQKLKYVHLWEPIRLLSIWVEIILIWLNSLHFFGWGTSIILLSILFKIFILPANILLLRSQKKVSQIRSSLKQELENIKSNFDGEIAHSKFMAAHKNKGVTPFYNLRPLFLTFIPIPFLIAIFNVLGELDLILNHSFLWIKNLAYPDAIYFFEYNIPFLGNSLNLLPILMTILTILGVIFLHNKILSLNELGRQKRNLYFMAFGFFVLFYPFPSAMVLYWTFTNLWSLIQQKIIKV